VSELVHERQEERKGEQDRRFDGRVLTPEFELPRDGDVQERDQTGDRDHARDQRDGPPEEGTQDVPIAEADEPVGAFPVDREGLAEALQLLAPRRRRIQPVGDQFVRGDRGGIEEPSRVQREDQVGDGFRVESSARFHPLDDELAHRPRAVHLGQQLRLPHLEAVVELAVVAREHRVVVAPSEPEDLHLAPVSHPRALVGDLQGIGEPGVDVRLNHRTFAERSLKGGPEDRGGRLREPSGQEPPEIDRSRGPEPSLPEVVHGDDQADPEEHEQDDGRHGCLLPGRCRSAHPASRGVETQRC
jgi:hypothetical protein